MNQPVVTFRSRSAPYLVISTLAYAQSALGGNFLPVKEGENSSIVYFRVYNNYGLAANIATMYNVRFSTFDDADPASHTAAKSPISQSWVRIYETGFGESTVAPATYTSYYGEDTPIGKSGVDSYYPEYGSDGGSHPYIRAGTDANGLGFIEFATYAQVPDGAWFANYTFALSVIYDWVA